jgi:hypothetical protein
LIGDEKHPAEEAAELAAEQADPDRLMDGEDPSSAHADDASHWLGVYQELYAFKQDLLAKLRTRLGEMSSGVAKEEALADARLLELELERFQRRADFWRRRLQELEGA